MLVNTNKEFLAFCNAIEECCKHSFIYLLERGYVI